MIFTSSKFGFDCSYYQDNNSTPQGVNFQTMKASGAEFVIIRTSYGNYKDEDAFVNLTNSKGVLPRAVYHYWWHGVSPLVQADLVLSMIAGQNIEGRVWLDLETTGTGAYSRPANWRAFCERIEAAGYRVGVYTGYPWWKTYALTSGEDLSYFYARPLWQAWYTSNPANVVIAGAWQKMMIWQDTSSYPGSAAGVESPTVDHNQWNDAYEFQTEWGTVTPPTGATMKKGILTASTQALNVRNAPSTGAVLTTLLPNDWAYGEIDAASGWLKVQYIIRVNGAREDFTAAYCSANTVYITLFDYVPPVTEDKITVTITENGVTKTYTITGEVVVS